MELDRLKILADKYFEAETTLDEERELREYLVNTKDIPKEYEVIKIMMGLVTSNQEIKAPKVEQKPARRTLWHWSIASGITIAAAAAAIIIMFVAPHASLDSTTEPSTMQTRGIMQHDLVCYVDGVKLTDMDAAYSEANAILGGVASDLESAMAHVNKFNIQGIK